MIAGAGVLVAGNAAAGAGKGREGFPRGGVLGADGFPVVRIPAAQRKF